ncbi:MAG: hypothetical protein PUP90_04845 [Nostoc sp. S4]|nr:hypothetical protein [Nostoc sp. S4]
MSKITISDLRTANSESLLINVSNLDYISIYGGADDPVSQIIDYGEKSLNFALLAFTIYEIAELAKSYNTQ